MLPVIRENHRHNFKVKDKFTAPIFITIHSTGISVTYDMIVEMYTPYVCTYIYIVFIRTKNMYNN